MKNLQPGRTVTEAIDVLASFAAKYADQAEPDERVRVYQALAEALVTPKARSLALDLAKAHSRVAALQLELTATVSGSRSAAARSCEG